MQLIALRGGLGNQLFQYAFALYIDQIHLQKPERVYIYWTGRDAYERQFELNQFLALRVPVMPATQALHCLMRGRVNRIYTILRRISRQLGFVIHYVRDKQLQPVERQVLIGNKNVLYDGYWQSSSMVNQVRHFLLQDLQPKTPFSKKYQELANKINNTPGATALHIRNDWGMVASEKKTRMQHSQKTLPIAYYAKAIAEVERRQRPTTFFVFADDISAAAALLSKIPTRSPFIYVEHDNRPAYEDLYLMQHCQNFILSNSTFCWWACWLAYATRPQEDLLSIMPKNWLADDSVNDKGKQYSDKLKIAANTLQL